MLERIACDHCNAHRDRAATDHETACKVCGFWGATPVQPSAGDLEFSSLLSVVRLDS